MPDLSAPYELLEIPPHARAMATRPKPEPTPEQRQALSGREAPTAASLPGKSEREILATLGTPNFKRRELDAQIWQYSGGSCSLLLYLYRQPQGSFQVRHVDARRLSGGALDPEACIRAVATERGAAMS